MYNSTMVLRSVTKGFFATALLIGGYFVVLSLVSGFEFAKNQFGEFWYFVVSLALGFGIQVGLYAYLRGAVKEMASRKVIVVSGTTSTAAMISCCTHYLANILPILGTAGIVTFVGEYQVEIFYVGLLMNIFGVAYISKKVIEFKKHTSPVVNLT